MYESPNASVAIVVKQLGEDCLILFQGNEPIAVGIIARVGDGSKPIGTIYSDSAEHKTIARFYFERDFRIADWF